MKLTLNEVNGKLTVHLDDEYLGCVLFALFGVVGVYEQDEEDPFAQWLPTRQEALFWLLEDSGNFSQETVELILEDADVDLSEGLTYTCDTENLWES